MNIKKILNFSFIFSLISFVGVWAFVVSPVAHAATGVNRQINFQGKLVNTSGTNVSDGSRTVVFTLYDAASNGTQLWQETQSVTTTDGIFQVALGSVTSLAAVNFNSDAIYLGIKVGSDSEMTPRVRFAAVPYAFNADKLNGVTATQSATGFTLTGGSSSTSTVSLTTSGGVLSLQSVGSDGLKFDTTGAAGVSLGTSNANAITIGKSGTTTTVSGGLTLTTGQTLTVNADAFTDLTGAGLTVSSNALAINLTSSGNTGSTSSNSGLEVSSSGLTLLKGCSDGQLLEYTDAGGWACGNDDAGGGSTQWTINSGTIYPGNETLDLLVGGTSSSSANFRVTGNAAFAGTQSVASVSARTSFAGLVVDNSGNGDLFTASSSGRTRFVIKQNGNVGIGSMTGSPIPNALLSMGNGVDAQKLLLFDSGNTRYGFGIQSAEMRIFGATTSVTTFGHISTSDGSTFSEKMRLDASGRLGIGATSLLGTLDVRPNLTNGGTIAVASVSGATSFAGLLVDNSGTGDLFTASSSGETRFVVKQSGHVGIGTNLPTANAPLDIRMSHNNGSRVDIRNSDTGTLASTGFIARADTAQFVADVFSSGSTTGGTGISGITAPNLIYLRGITTNRMLIGTSQSAPVSFSTNNVVRGTFDTSGNLGIGTMSPVATLDVRGQSGTTPIASLSATTAFAGLVVDNRGNGDLFTASSSGLNRFVLKQDGRVGIGTALSAASDIGMLGIANHASLAEIQFTGNAVTSILNSGNQAMYLNTTGGDLYLGANGSGTTHLAVKSTGLVGIGTVTPLATLDLRAQSGTIPVASVSGVTSFASMVLDNRGNGDLFTASSSGLNRFVVKQDGNIGIGVDMPTALLDMSKTNNGTAAQFLRLRSTGTNVGTGEQISFVEGNLETSRIESVDDGSGAVSMRFYTYNSGLAETLRIAGNGNLGIGDSSPTEAKLVVGSAGAGNVFLTLDTAGTTNNAVCWDNSGATLLYDCDGTPADYAESYPVANDVNYGEIVMTTNTMVTTTIGTRVPKLVKAIQGGKGAVIGIISDNYHDFTSAGKEEIAPEDNPLPVALNGRVPVKVTSENGTIAVGDPVAVSSVPGIAAKATRAGQIIARALEPYENTDPKAIGSIMVFVQNSWYDPGQYTGLAYNDAAIFGASYVHELLNLASISALLDDAVTESTMNSITATMSGGLTVDGNASISGNLRVQNNALIEGILNVVDTLTTNNLIVSKVSDFFGTVIFHKRVEFRDSPRFNNDTVGTVVIKEGEESATVTFEEEYEDIPVTTVTLKADSEVIENAVLAGELRYVVTKQTTKGFQIKLHTPAQEAITFSWTTFASLEE